MSRPRRDAAVCSSLLIFKRKRLLRPPQFQRLQYESAAVPAPIQINVLLRLERNFFFNVYDSSDFLLRYELGIAARSPRDIYIRKCYTISCKREVPPSPADGNPYRRDVRPVTDTSIDGHSFVSFYHEPHTIDVVGHRHRRTSVTQIVSQISATSFKLIKPVIDSGIKNIKKNPAVYAMMSMALIRALGLRGGASETVCRLQYDSG
ncbi:hypothetical protein EVAR_95130_1 [Eumeta japonica]|uniref:Uncharacterized protein n=1 Tax=Eumeta variegata TaxID=151549 RepID=A0A4C1W696_EUMVA|nr:hypothetical protein EVAR_95130_1 [Eumeta japonica]